MMEWFFPDRLFVLPQNCTTFGQSIEAPRKKYIRADAARAEAEAMVRAEREAIAAFIESHAYCTNGGETSLEPSRFPGMDRHHATIAAAIRARSEGGA